MMKNYFKFILAFFTITIFLVSCGRGSDSPNPPTTDTQKPTAPTNLTTNNITTNSFTLNWTSSTDNVSVTRYNVYVNDVVIGSTTSTNYAVTGLTASTSYTVYVKAKDAAGNISDKSNTLSVNTSSVSYTAVVNTTTSYEGSTTAIDKVLLGGSIAKGFVFDVTTAGTAKVEVLGTLTSGAPAVSYYWINGADNADINAACSTLNSTVAKTSINSQSFTINLNAGKNVICFKTARYSGLINNGGAVGLKITLASNVAFTTISYTADSVSGNVAAVQKQEHGLINGTGVSGNTEGVNAAWGTIKLTPYNDENATVYDGNLYPKISGLTLGTTADWSTGNVAGWSNLDFKNTQGTNGQNFILKNSDDTNLFINSNSSFSSNVLNFQSTNSIQIVKSYYNYAFLILKLNVFNTNSNQFGSANVSFVYKSVKFVGNPETWVYNTSGVRIQ
ncbi:fibronectin type III domain-containing protein [Cloacibacterium normanense]|uniref:fibronectin type III domain-containing protein n=1 Tax=Cloacibacterium normanense TaxID=237258 RepID=UPI00391B55FF